MNCFLLMPLLRTQNRFLSLYIIPYFVGNSARPPTLTRPGTRVSEVNYVSKVSLLNRSKFFAYVLIEDFEVSVKGERCPRNNDLTLCWTL